MTTDTPTRERAKDAVAVRREQLAVAKRAERTRAVAASHATRRPEPSESVKRLLKDMDAALVEVARTKAVLSNPRNTGPVKRNARIMQRLALAKVRELTDRIEKLWQAQTDAAWANVALVETVNLERARGGEVEAHPVGYVRINNHDGFDSLIRRGYFSQDQIDAGMRYREGVEGREADVGSQMGAIGAVGGTAHDNDKFVANKCVQARKTARVQTIERAVALQCRDEPAALQMLRWVVGLGNSLSAFGEGRAFSRHVTALQRALDVAGDLKPGENG